MATQDASTQPTRPDWKTVLREGDEDAFRETIKPYLDTLFAAARRELSFYIEQGAIHQDDFTPEEVTGEALVQAWHHRQQRPEPMSLRGWLLGTQHRVLTRLVEEQKQYRADKTISLDEPVPHTRDHGQNPQERFSDLYRPERHVTWEDVTPSRRPVDYEVPLNADKPTPSGMIEGTTRHVVMMHDEFEMSLPEVAFTMNRRVNEIAAQLEQARTTMRERTGGTAPFEEAEQPAPSPDSDA